VTRCDPRLVALVSASNCTTSTCLLTNSGGAFRPGTRSHPGTATRSAAPTSTGGYAFSRRPMLPSWPCSTPRQIQTEPLSGVHRTYVHQIVRSTRPLPTRGRSWTQRHEPTLTWQITRRRRDAGPAGLPSPLGSGHHRWRMWSPLRCDLGCAEWAECTRSLEPALPDRGAA
jgi:hypothetical protein